MVADGRVIALEAAEGTDHMLARIAELRRLGRVSAPISVGVLVKTPKPTQDRRFDLPSIGPRTIELVASAGLAGLAVSAGSTMIAEAQETIAAADRAKIFVVGVREAAAGVGLSPWQRLRDVELPLAAPVILAGIRVSVTIAIGTATIGSTVGALTLGTPIFDGLVANKIAFVVEGAVLVALFAILTDLLFERLERWLITPAS